MLDIKNKKVVIWDWNGTLLNDIDVCIDCMNTLLKRREISPLNRIRYRHIFTFPVKEYYQKAGFDFTIEKFENPAIEFIDCYHKNLFKANLFDFVLDVLDVFDKKGVIQVVLSAMEHESLVKSLKEKGIFSFFKEISGIDNHYANSKLEIGRKLIQKLNLSMKDILLIGDSLHDFDVANALSIDHLLIANGHQSKERLLAESDNVLSELKDLMALIN